jgi:hypothetical protein
MVIAWLAGTLAWRVGRKFKLDTRHQVFYRMQYMSECVKF